MFPIVVNDNFGIKFLVLVAIISVGCAQDVTITKCLGSVWLNFNAINSDPIEILTADVSSQLKTGDKCLAKTCGDLILNFTKSYTQDFDLTKPSIEVENVTTILTEASEEGDLTPIGQYICDTIGMDFSGFLSVLGNHICSDMSETKQRVDTAVQVNVCCNNATFTTDDCKSP